MTTALETRKALQTMLGVTPDGEFGPHSLAALHSLINTPGEALWPIPAQDDGWHEVMASSFADPADVTAFRHCKALGGSDQECFKVGDNGIGKWGDDCTAGSGPKCALPPEDWLARWGVNARHAKVIVEIGDKSVICEMDDTMPHRANITNGAGVDLNPDAVAALGQHVPLMTKARWRWA